MRPNLPRFCQQSHTALVMAAWWLVGLHLSCLAVENQTVPTIAASATPQSASRSTSGGQGGAAQADFDSLIDLIQSTVAYDTWQENGTGEGEIMPFPTGVYADAQGTLRFSTDSPAIPSLRRESDGQTGATDARRPSPLRYVSLARLEQTIGELQRQHAPLLPEMLTLAGLQRIEYMFADPENHDLILAGPAGDWRSQPPGMIVSTATGQPVQRLDDLLTLWRLQMQGSKPFGCSIVPRQAALAKTQEFLQASASSPLEPGQRKEWLASLRETLGTQDVEFTSLAPDSHLALVLLLADYHMKLIGMGLAEGVPGVTDYLDTVELLPDGSAPPMAVLRWWFAMDYPDVQTDASRQVYRLPARGVRVLSENELLAARGQRVHTNQSDELNRRFAEAFTEHFAAIREKYPLYGELQNVFDLALVLAIIEQEKLLERVGWQPSLLVDSESLRLPRLQVPREVQTVVNSRLLNRRHIIAGISGGVWVDAKHTLKTMTADSPKELQKAPATQSWWWDETGS